jgi:hypothetical protein
MSSIDQPAITSVLALFHYIYTVLSIVDVMEMQHSVENVVVVFSICSIPN